MGQDRRSGIIRRVIRSTASWVGMVAAANLAVTGTAHADVASEMNSFFSDAGGAANVTGPSAFTGDRKSVVSGKSVSVRVDLGGRGFITKKNTNTTRDNQSDEK